VRREVEGESGGGYSVFARELLKLTEGKDLPIVDGRVTKFKAVLSREEIPTSLPIESS